MSERRSLAAPEELSIAGLEKYKEICHKVLTVCSGQGIRDQSDQESEVRCFSLLLMFRTRQESFQSEMFCLSLTLVMIDGLKAL